MLLLLGIHERRGQHDRHGSIGVALTNETEVVCSCSCASSLHQPSIPTKPAALSCSFNKIQTCTCTHSCTGAASTMSLTDHHHSMLRVELTVGGLRATTLDFFSLKLPTRVLRRSNPNIAKGLPSVTEKPPGMRQCISGERVVIN